MNKKLKALNFDEEPLLSYLPTAHRMSYLSLSVIFGKYYETEIEVNPPNGDPAGIKDACERAYAEFKTDLDRFIDADPSTYTMGKIK